MRGGREVPTLQINLISEGKSTHERRKGSVYHENKSDI